MHARLETNIMENAERLSCGNRMSLRIVPNIAQYVECGALPIGTYACNMKW